jgi:hypothetical protein
LHHYVIGGLTVASELALPGTIITTFSAQEAAVTVRYAEVPETLENVTAHGPNWQMDETRLLLKVPNVARYLISSGRDIAVQPEQGASEQDAAIFVLGTAFGILLHQRGVMVLHASAIAENGGAIAICGRSGAGKSTLAAALCRTDCRFVTDDVCAVGLDDRGRPMILPDGRQLKLWRDAIDRLGLAPQAGDAVRQSFEKYFVAPKNPPASSTPLVAIYVLRELRPPRAAGIEALTLPDAMRLLQREAYRPGLLNKIGKKGDIFAKATTTLSHARTFTLTRQLGFEHLSQTLNELRAHWQSLQRAM